jgi:parallel beta-helix repeat protein
MTDGRIWSLVAPLIALTHKTRKSPRSALSPTAGGEPHCRRCCFRALVVLLLLACSLAEATAKDFYAAVNGSSSNAGTSSAPWPLDYAIANAGTSNTIILMPGVYPARSWTVSTSYLTLKSQTKWGAWLVNSPDSGVKIAATDWSVNSLTLDGLVISNAFRNGVEIFSGAGHIIRNCWILRSGQFTPSGGQNESGISCSALVNTLVEDNLIEYNGCTAGYDHGIYLGGTNNIVRGNVVRYNAAYGIQLYSHSPESVTGNRVYHNLVYGNCTLGDSAGRSEMVLFTRYSSMTNWVFNNTFLSKLPYAVQVESGMYGWFTNNIIVGTTAGFYPSGTIYGDYNLSTAPLRNAGSHDVVTNYLGFVNSSEGLYWLKSDSPARGKALSNIAGPVDFFGNPVSSVTDIGSFQYSATYASDQRVLDPSPASPNYWLNLSATNSGSAGISVTPTIQDFGSLLVGSTADRAFSVQNTGSSTLSGSVTVSAPFSIVSGSPYTIAVAQTQTVTVRYSPTIARTDNQTISFSGANGASATVSGSATTPPVQGSLTFQAPSGIITAPFVANNGYISQASDTSVDTGGQAVYNFATTNSGLYVIEAIVNATNDSANSFYVNIDGQPTDPTMIWDIPVTSGFEQRLVSWRGNGTFDNDQFVPALFNLSAGTHQLIIIGREANTELQQISIVQLPNAPENLHIVAGP